MTDPASRDPAEREIDARVERLAKWLDAKWARHREIEDKDAAQALRDLSADYFRLLREKQARTPQGGAEPRKIEERRAYALEMVKRVSDISLNSTNRYTAEKELNRAISWLTEAALASQGAPAEQPTDTGEKP